MVLRSLVRVLVTVLAVLTVQAAVNGPSDCCTVAAMLSAISERHQCCDSTEAADRNDGRDEGHCPCPLPCGAGCTGHGVRALAPCESTVVAAPTAELVTQLPHSIDLPPGPEPGDILHVPKSFRS
jgi:hypothetical protein